jgi:hypothetical protein
MHSKGWHENMDELQKRFEFQDLRFFGWWVGEWREIVSGGNEYSPQRQGTSVPPPSSENIPALTHTFHALFNRVRRAKT